MRILKTYEEKSELEIGDWVVFGLNAWSNPDLGKITDIRKMKSIYIAGDYTAYVVEVEGPTR